MNVLYLSTQPGLPSTLWQGASGKWYRTKNEAIQDKGVNTINPDDIELNKNWFQRNKRTIIIATICSVLVIAAVIALYKYNIIKF